MRLIAAARSIAAIACLLVSACAGAQSGDFQEASRLARAGQPAQALERLDGVLKANPKDARARMLKGTILTDLGKVAEAIDTFNSLVDDYPELPEPYNNLAVIYAAQGQYDKARNALELSIRAHPSYATAHENLGDVHARIAAQSYEKAVQLDKNNAGARGKLEKLRELLPATPRAARPAASSNVPAPGTTAGAPLASQPHHIAPPRNANSAREVIKAVRQWAKAWSDKDVDGFLAFYAPDFQTPDDKPRSDWEAARKMTIAKPKKIEVRVESPKVEFSGDNRVTVTFRQNYRSVNVKQASTKTLVMVKSGEHWLIQQERAGG